MTDLEDDHEVDLPAQRRTRTTQQRAVNRLIKRLQVMKDEDKPGELSLHQLQEKETEVETIIRRGNRCNDHLMDDELDEALQAADEVAWNIFQDATAAATRLCQELIALRTGSCLAEEAATSLTEVHEKITGDPTGDYSDYFPEIKLLIDELNETLRGSTIPADHTLRASAKELKSRLGDIRVKKIVPPSTDSKDCLKLEDSDPYKLPKIHLPKFHGGLEEWHHYWGRFQTAVHDNAKLGVEAKMAQLLETIDDPTLTTYLNSCNDGTGRYPEVIACL